MPEEKKEDQKKEDKKTEQCCCCGGSKNKFAVITIIVILIAILGVYASSWKKEKDEKISLGLSSSDFPYRDYTQEELNKMYPQIKNADVPTRVAPEETYAKFRQAFKENNLELAIEQLSKESKNYEENVETVTQAYEENRFLEVYEAYPEKVTQSSMYEAIAQYEYDVEEDGEIFVNSIDFTKDSNGDWKLDSL